MKRYILFAGERYYAAGGALDLVGWFDSIADIEVVLQGWKDTDNERDWWHIYDCTEQKIVETSGDQAFSYR